MTLARTRNDIITSAMELIGAKAADESLAAADVQTASKALDKLVKKLQSKGAHLWSERTFTLFLQPAQIEYQFGGTNTDEATESFTETTLSADAAAAATTVSLTSSTGLLAGDRIGIKLDDGTLHWTTIKNLSALSLTTAMPSLATSGNAVYFYTTKIGKILRIPDARRVQSSNQIEMVQMGRIDYLNLPNKTTSGTPVQFYYQPLIDTGKLFIWPAPTSTDTYLDCTGYFPLDVFDDSADAPDFPDEWLEALEYNLAVRLAPRFGQPLSPEVAFIAESSLQDVLDWDQGDASVFIQAGRGRGM